MTIVRSCLLSLLVPRQAAAFRGARLTVSYASSRSVEPAGATRSGEASSEARLCRRRPSLAARPWHSRPASEPFLLRRFYSTAFPFDARDDSI